MPPDESPAIGSAARPLISVQALAERLRDATLAARTLVADVRWILGQPGAGRAAYDSDHIPGAIHLDLDADLADPAGFGAPGRHPLPSPAEAASRSSTVGGTPGSLLVNRPRRTSRPGSRPAA